MLVVLAKLNQAEVCLAVIVKVAFALHCVWTCRIGLDCFALFCHRLSIGEDGIFRKVRHTNRFR